MKKYRTLMLLLSLSLFFVLIYTYEIKDGDVREKIMKQNSLVVKLKPDEINSIEIRNSYDHFKFSKLEEDWLVTEPISDFADRFVMQRLLNFFSDKSFLQNLTDDISKETEVTFGFGPQNQWISVSDNEGRTYKVWISDKEAMQLQTYLKVDVSGYQNKTFYYLADPAWRTEFNRTLLYFRDKFVFREDMNQVFKFEKYVNNKKLYTIVNVNEDEWIYSQKDNEIPIDKTMAFQVIQDLVQVSATDFIEKSDLQKGQHDKLGFHQKSPYFIFYLKSGAGEETALRMYYSNAKQKTYLDIKDKIYEIFPNALSFLGWTLDDYKNRRMPFAIIEDRVNKIQIILPHSKKEFHKESGDWSEGFHGNRLLRHLAQMEVKAFSPQKLPPAYDSQIRFYSEDELMLELSWQETKSPEITMTSSAFSETFLVDAAAWRKVLEVATKTGEAWEPTSESNHQHE